MELVYIQQEINNHKTKLLNLIKNLINSQLIDEEIYINSEIKKESECLNSLLIVKQKSVMNRMNTNNNNMNLNPLMFQPLNINQMQFQQQQIMQNNFQNNNNNEIYNQIINIQFRSCESGKIYVLQSHPNEKISVLIDKYREKANDYNNNYFNFLGKDLNGLSLTLNEYGIIDNSLITVEKKGKLKSGNFWNKSLFIKKMYIPFIINKYNII